MKTVIMAGGRGTRIAAFSKELNQGLEIPKPMISIGGMPVLERELASLKEQGFDDIILTVGHLGHQIMNYFGDGRINSPVTHKPFGVHISYYVEEEPIGNAGALFQLKNQLTEDFLLLNADAVFDVDFNRFVDYHKQKGGWVTLFTHANNHPYDSGLVITDADGRVQQWLAKEDVRPQWYTNQVNAGLHVVSPRILQQVITTTKVDLDRQLLKPLAGKGLMYAYDSPEYVQDMGTPERYEEVSNACKKGIMKGKNLRYKQKAICLDRDGTINRYVGYLRSIDDFVLLPGVAEAIRKINQSGYLAIVVTNQPVVARGDITISQLEEIHKKMETLLGRSGAFVDAIYYCPHHPDKGFQGERVELKFDCDCRKPKPGMLLRAAADFNVNLSQSWMVGDDRRDIETGKNAGCKTAYIGNNVDFHQDVTASSLLDFVDTILMEGD
jgi:D-glycero-D-manno-heptose 1,7-bisphosphate phosphatase